MAINKDGSSSKPGDWAGAGGMGAGSYSQPSYRSSYDSRGNKLTDASGRATGFGNAAPGGNGRGPWPGGYATPVMRQPLSPVPPVAAPPEVNPVVAALARRPAVTQEDIPAAPVMSQYGPRVQGVPASQYGANNPASGFSLANFNRQGTWGGGQQTTINKSPGGGGYTNINKNGGGYGYSSYGGPR